MLIRRTPDPSLGAGYECQNLACSLGHVAARVVDRSLGPAACL
jgi:hypothetical protein